jgi:hypothetical protein
MADLGRQMTFIYEPRKVPVVLSPDEVRRFLEAAPWCPMGKRPAMKAGLRLLGRSGAS